MKVFFGSKPMAMISRAFCSAKRWASFRVSLGVWKNFSSSVNIMTRGTLKTSCRYLL